MNIEFAWGDPAVCQNGDNRPGRFRKNTLCFVCACRAESAEATAKLEKEQRKADREQRKIEKQKQRKGERARSGRRQFNGDSYDDLNDEMPDAGQTKRRY